MKNDDFGDRMKLQKEALDLAEDFGHNYDNISFSGAAELAWLVRKLFGKEDGPRPSDDDFDD